MAMSLERRQKIASEKKALIKNTALNLFDQKGYRETTIDDIARMAGISKGLIYKYFTSKKEIVLSFEDAIENCGADLRAQETPVDALRLAAKRVLLGYDETGYHAPIRILINCYVNGDVSSSDLSSFYSFDDYGKREYGPLFKKGQEMGLFRNGDPITMGDLFWHLIIGYSVRMAHTDSLYVTAKMIEDMLSLFVE